MELGLNQKGEQMRTSKSKANKSFLILCVALLFLASVILTTTGAWFTSSSSASTPGSSTEFRFATFGKVAIDVGGYQHVDANGKAITDRKGGTGIIMPGDKVTSSSIKITYDADGTADTDKVWYLIKLDSTNKYYVVSNGALSEVTTTKQAQMIQQGSANALTIKGEVVTVQVDGTTYSLDGSTSSSSIGNSAQGKKLTALGAKYGLITIGSNGNTYKVAIIQYYNINATQAFTELKTLLDSMSN